MLVEYLEVVAETDVFLAVPPALPYTWKLRKDPARLVDSPPCVVAFGVENRIPRTEERPTKGCGGHSTLKEVLP
jgi:hypothetical protein